MATLVFDIDGVLCENGWTGRYGQAPPYPHGIARVNRCHGRGHTVVLQTARGMKKYAGDAGAAREACEEVTLDWLRRHGVKFHEVRFGKASGDLYADDRGCRVESAAGERDWDENFEPLLARLEQEEARAGLSV